MEVKWLHDFLSLVDTGNFSRSAELRATTQPAFSRRIKSLEEWVGMPLFDRRTQPISLTPAGEQLRPTVEEILRRLYQCREDIREAGKAGATTIKFAATHSLSLTFFPSWIRSIEQRTHLLSTRLDSGQVENCVQSLLRGDCHFMLTHTHPSVELNLPPAHFTSVRVGEDRLVPVGVPASHGGPRWHLPGSRQTPVDYLAYAETSAIGRAVEKMLASRSPAVFLRRVFVSHLAAVLLSVTRDGRGVSWLPESQVQDELKAGTLVVAGDETWFIPVEIRLFRSNDPLPPASEAFWSLVMRDAMAADAASALR